MGGGYDVIVIGGGHAGAEAAHASGRLGARTALVTMSLEAIGRMSCNPAIGGVGKGQMVREIDAVGGLMGRATDATGIQFRMLNRRKGPAVWSPRAQADSDLYTRQLRRLLAETPNLELLTGTAETVETVERDGRGHVSGVRLADGRRLRCSAVVIASGTFLRGLMHCGPQQHPGGRVGEPAADRLSTSLRELGLELGRLKTGTPPRVHRDSVDFTSLEAQPGDERPVGFSFLTDRLSRPQVQCWITSTNERTHELIRANLHRAPMYSGQIVSRGPRYCPSIEDKVVRFADKPRHQIFLEPEGRDSERIYCNGISTSLPADVQEAMVHSIAGLQQARILQAGYAVEYDFVRPEQLSATLETRRVGGLFLAGQINGTSGYEEAAGQGLIAGLNAALQLAGGEPVVLRRDQAYIGVMIDDLMTRPLTEPYRMFTSRAEYRLLLRADNADQRLTPLGRQVGLADERRWKRYQEKMAWLGRWRERFAELGEGQGLLRQWAARSELEVGGLLAELDGDSVPAVAEQALEALLIETKYAGYLARQARQVERLGELEDWRIPQSFDYRRVAHLRREAQERLARVCPHNLGQASRVEGVSPADVAVLMVHLRR